MGVRPGYKQTEVGVIPEEWEVSNFAAIAEIIDPQPDHRTPPEASLGEPYIGISDFQNHNTVDWNGCRKIISKAVDKQQASFKIREGDIIFGKIGTIGSPRFLPLTSFRYALSANVILIQPRIEPYFVMAWLTSSTAERSISQELHSTSQAAFGINKMRCLPIALPPLPERHAIAAALSDVDALLEALERLIAKKRDLKQAAMQQLLTGQTRLPGYDKEKVYKQTEVGVIPQDWNLECIESFARIATGTKNTQDRETDGQYPFFVRSQTVERISSYSFDGEAVLTAGDGVGTGKVFHYINGKFDVHQRVYCIHDFAERINGYFFFLCFSSRFYNRIMQMTAKSSVDSVRREMIANMLVPLPPTKDEQTAIAAVLTDIDAELAALQQRLDKTRDLKQAMMQELLTGRTRLVLSEASHA
jgi:type I restriction enzyme S subunit